MKKPHLILITLTLGLIVVQGCGTSGTSNQPWDKPLQDDNRPGYKADSAPPLNRDAK